MPEIEVKILGIDSADVEKRLIALGAKKIFSGIVRSIHFDRSPSLRSKGCFLRLRFFKGEEGFKNRGELCFKGPKQVEDGCKVREEIESVVESPHLVLTIFKRLGYDVTLDNEKRRISYELEGAHFDLDFYPGVEPYMEIEGPDAASIERAIERLELSNFERSDESARELFDRKWPEVDLDWLKF